VSASWQSLRLEVLDDLEGVVDDFVDGEAAGNHVAGSSAVVDDDERLPGDSLLSIEDSILLGDLARPVSKQRNLALAFQTPIRP